MYGDSIFILGIHSLSFCMFLSSSSSFSFYWSTCSFFKPVHSYHSFRNLLYGSRQSRCTLLLLLTTPYSTLVYCVCCTCSHSAVLWHSCIPLSCFPSPHFFLSYILPSLLSSFSVRTIYSSFVHLK
ncbi:hypothetical protein CPC08DRAFT_482529 [Agrocybe pediades]|nr:hypothetical protein CPC08DRAFT_482529 [Agrocybe pediades]